MEKEIKFLKCKPGEDTIRNLPSSNWCLIILANDNQTDYFNEIINNAIDNNVAYICGVGKQHDLIHELADEELSYRYTEVSQKHYPKHVVITVGNEDIEKGLWSGVYASEHPDVPIQQIIIIDMEDFTSAGNILLEKFSGGYIPN